MWRRPLNIVKTHPVARRWLVFFNDREYYLRLIHFGLPIAFQQLIFTLLNLVSNLMVGQLGDTTIAAVGLANQIFFLVNLMVFGIGSGSAMFTAQLWGKKDIKNIHKVLGLALTLSLTGGLLFFLATQLIPAQVLSIYSKDPQVIAEGSSFLQIFGFSFIFFAITATYSLVLRSIGQVRLPVAVSISALLLNIILSYGLIFGKFGLPALGANGAAWSILIARAVECILLVSLTYLRKLPIAASLWELFSYNTAFAIKVLKPVIPVTINEILWSLGITAYQVIYARIGTEQFAAINIAGTISDLIVVAFIGIGNATAILVGNLIGAGEVQKAQDYGGRSTILGAVGGFTIGMLVLLFSPFILSLYRVSPQVITYAHNILIINCSFMWLKMMNLVLFMGIFRAGGDTRFALVLDGLIIWLVGVPLTAYGAFVLNLPITLVFMLTLSEEFAKWALAIWRFLSRRWIHNLADTVSVPIPVELEPLQE